MKGIQPQKNSVKQTGKAQTIIGDYIDKGKYLKKIKDGGEINLQNIAIREALQKRKATQSHKMTTYHTTHNSQHDLNDMVKSPLVNTEANKKES